jgi:small subunit ribosomal protein S16
LVKLRLMRGGRKKRPFYRIIAADSAAKRDGRFLEKVGSYNPVASATESQIVLDVERAMYWLMNGAEPTRTTRNILSAEGVMLRLHLTKKGVEAEKIEEAVSSYLSERSKRLEEKNKKTETKKAKAATKVAEVVEEKKEEVKTEVVKTEVVATEEVVEEIKTEAAVTEEVPDAPAEETVADENKSESAEA